MADLSTSIDPKHEAYVEPQLEESGNDSSDLLSTAFTSHELTASAPTKGTGTICGCCFC
ncbi:MAG TPA: hypothetical protein VKV02_07185 [Acidobacteriaceae bacterium]|nr:hypothetical protein [Acidobacteriaceae bacterium]